MGTTRVFSVFLIYSYADMYLLCASNLAIFIAEHFASFYVYVITIENK